MNLITQSSTKIDQFILDFNQFCQLSHKLYIQFTDEILRKQLAQYKNMFVVHHGKMSYIPFDLLLKNEVATIKNIKDANYSELPLLIKDIVTSYHLSSTIRCSMETNTPKQSSKNNSIVAFAPKYDPSKYDQCDGDASCAIRRNLRNLKGTKMECEFLGNDYNATIFENKQATESNFRENVINASIIHLAMHGSSIMKKQTYQALYLVNVQSFHKKR